MGAVLWATSTVGVVAGGLVGQLHGTTPGRASLVGSGAFWSALIAGMGVAAVTADEEVALLSAAVALNVGAVGGVLLGDSMRPSIARVRFIDLGGISGGLLVGGLYLAFAGEKADEQMALAAVAAGFTAGLITGVHLTQDMKPDDPSRKDDAGLTMVPTLAPATHGAGATLGLAGAF